jgi:hypothetical protein
MSTPTTTPTSAAPPRSSPDRREARLEHHKPGRRAPAATRGGAVLDRLGGGAGAPGGQLGCRGWTLVSRRHERRRRAARGSRRRRGREGRLVLGGRDRTTCRTPSACGRRRRSDRRGGAPERETARHRGCDGSRSRGQRTTRDIAGASQSRGSTRRTPRCFTRLGGVRSFRLALWPTVPADEAVVRRRATSATRQRTTSANGIDRGASCSRKSLARAPRSPTTTVGRRGRSVFI